MSLKDKLIKIQNIASTASSKASEIKDKVAEATTDLYQATKLKAETFNKQVKDYIASQKFEDDLDRFAAEIGIDFSKEKNQNLVSNDRNTRISAKSSIIFKKSALDIGSPSTLDILSFAIPGGTTGRQLKMVFKSGQFIFLFIKAIQIVCSENSATDSDSKVA